MITPPLNDHDCLGAIHAQVIAAVQRADAMTVQWARRLGSRAAIVRWLRGLPQRDDTGGPGDGPRVAACAPPQRLRLAPFPGDPNCVERAAIYLLLADLIDPSTERRLATIDTPAGLHTLPVEAGRPVVLDPRVPRNAAQAGLDQATGRPLADSLASSVAWVTRTAAEPLAVLPGGERTHRNGALALAGVARGEPVPPSCHACVASMLAIAGREAHRWGDAGRAVVARVERAALDLARGEDDHSPVGVDGAHDPRNLRLRIDPAAVMRTVARLGGEVGTTVLGAQLGALGVSPAVIGVIESELRREGLTLGPLARLGTSPVSAR